MSTLPVPSFLSLSTPSVLHQELHTSDESDCDDLDPKTGMEVQEAYCLGCGGEIERMFLYQYERNIDFILKADFRE